MKKVILMAALVGTNVSAGMMETFKQMAEGSNRSAKEKTLGIDLNCTNFAGTWKQISCEGAGTDKNNLVIKQTGCTNFYIDDENMSIGSLKTTSIGSDFEKPSSWMWAFSWNDSRNILQAYATGVQSFNQKYAGLQASGRYSIIDEKLVVDMRFVGQDMNTLETSKFFNSRCTYEKQN